MAIVEYLYIDERRVNSYADQIGSSTIYDKVPSLVAEIGLTGPKAITAQQRYPRAATTHEKIERLLLHLKKQKAVMEARPSGQDRSELISVDTTPFVCESCSAGKVTIPHTEKSNLNHDGLNLWISVERDQRRDMLCLIEDYREYDRRPHNCSGYSAYTLLQSIVNALGDELGLTTIAEAFPPGDRDHNWIGDWHRVVGLMGRFARDPFQFFSQLDCIVSLPRDIVTLYRIRDFGPEVAGVKRFGHTSTFGYPIYIATE